MPVCSGCQLQRRMLSDQSALPLTKAEDKIREPQVRGVHKLLGQRANRHARKHQCVHSTPEQGIHKQPNAGRALADVVDGCCGVVPPATHRPHSALHHDMRSRQSARLS